MNTRPNIVLITADSLRADRLGCYGYRLPTTPNLDTFAGESTRFTHAFSNGPNTPHAFPAIMAGRCSLQSRKLGLFDVPVTLAEALQQTGYHTMGFNAANPYISRYFHYDRGFDQFYDYLTFEIPQPRGERRLPAESESASVDHSSLITIPGLDVERYLVGEESIRAKAQLEMQFHEHVFHAVEKRPEDKPVFLWLHYMDTHYPYLPQREPQVELNGHSISREENLRLNQRVRENAALSPEALARVSGLYNASVRQLDAKVGELFDFLKRTALYDSSLIVFTADHGEEFMDHGDLQHKSKLYDELMHVPLMVKRPRQSRYYARSDLVSLLQIAPSILACLDIENLFEYQSFFEDSSSYVDNRNMAAFAAASYGTDGRTPTDERMLQTDIMPKVYCCRSQHMKVITDTGGESQVFNLLSDPTESRNLFGSDNGEAKALLGALTDYVADLETTRVKQQVLQLRDRMTEGI
ncbi:MAG: sulfatase [Calditrichaeota bacterium]|nr:sulfatase [Calditrichota bacterium]